MAEKREKPSLFVIIPPPVWALLFIVSAWAIGRALGLDAIFRQIIAGWTVFALGFAISASGRLAFARAGTEVLPVSEQNSTLVTTGPYRFTRNPMYLGILVAMIGLALLIGTAPAYAAVLVFFLFVNFISIPFEEKKMERQFGEAWREYKSRVRRWI